MRELVLVLCWLGVLQSLLLSGYFLSTIQRNSNRFFLGLALLLVAVRAAKSTLFVFSPDVPLVIFNIGFAAHAGIGPALLLYVRSLQKDFAWRPVMFLHFLPAVLILASSSVLSLGSFWYTGGYTALLFYTLIYCAAYLWAFAKALRKEGAMKQEGIGGLLIVFTIFLVAYFSNYVLRASDYMVGPVIYSILIFGISFIAIRNNTFFTREFRKKYQNLKLTEETACAYHTRIVKALEDEKLFLKPDLSLQQLSESSGVPAYALSYIIGERLNTNFANLVNTYRVAEAKKLLADPAKDHLTIAGIAFESGFNTLSSFNSAFKKLNNTTPSEFKKSM